MSPTAPASALVSDFLGQVTLKGCQTGFESEGNLQLPPKRGAGDKRGAVGDAAEAGDFPAERVCGNPRDQVSEKIRHADTK